MGAAVDAAGAAPRRGHVEQPASPGRPGIRDHIDPRRRRGRGASATAGRPRPPSCPGLRGSPWTRPATPLRERRRAACRDGNRVRRVDRSTGVITTVAGSGVRGSAGDGGPATAAQLSDPGGVVVDGSGNVLVADTGNSRIRRVDATTGVISSVSGTGTPGYSGDGGPATLAALNKPAAVALDGAGNLFVADTGNAAVRRVDAKTGVIETVRRVTDPQRPDSILPRGIAVEPTGNLLVSGRMNMAYGFWYSGIWRIDSASGATSTLVGASMRGDGFDGDGGPATGARVSEPSGIFLDTAGNLFLADSGNDRIRAVFSCVPPPAPALADPTGVSPTSATLSWTPVASAFRYDLTVDTVDPPVRIVAGDLGYTTPTPFTIPPGTSYSYPVSNLLPGTTY